MGFRDIRALIANSPARDVGIGATSTEIEQAERVLNMRISGSYRRFLEAFGWGGIEDIELFGVGRDVPAHLDLVRVARSERTEANPPLPPALVPLMNDGAGNLYCLDAREVYRDEHPVVFWNHEEGQEQEPELVADDFCSWLQPLLMSRT